MNSWSSKDYLFQIPQQHPTIAYPAHDNRILVEPELIEQL